MICKTLIVLSCLSLSLALPLSSSHSPNNATFSDCTGEPNTFPVWDSTPVEIARVKNGILQQVGGKSNSVYLVHLFGTPYERGLAHGQLLKNVTRVMYDQFDVWLEDQIADAVKKYLPEQITRVIASGGVKAALEFVRIMTKKFTPSHFDEEMKGLAEGLEMDENRVIRMHMFPELIKAACSMFGAWGDATIQNENGAGGLIQLRALDWAVDCPLRNVPAVLIYHSSDTTKSENFAVLSWAGFLGTMTGMSDHMGVSEKKWYHSAPSETVPHGYPWNFLLRDILEFDRSLDEAEARIKNAKKTASIFVGIGNKDSMKFVAEEYGVKTNVVFDDDTDFPGYAPSALQHPKMKNLVYIDKHTQPSSQWCMADVLKKNYGKISPAATIELVSRLQTGDIHLAFYDFANNDMYVSVAATDGEGKSEKEILKAYENQMIRLHLSSLYAVAAPDCK